MEDLCTYTIMCNISANLVTLLIIKLLITIRSMPQLHVYLQ